MAQEVLIILAPHLALSLSQLVNGLLCQSFDFFATSRTCALDSYMRGATVAEFPQLKPRKIC